MANLSDYAENAILNHILRNVAMTSPATVYLALFTTDPTDANTGTEVSGGSYARQAVAFAAPSGGSTSNSAQISFPVATASWGTITHAGIYDALTVGNLLFHGPLGASKTIANTDQLVFNAGQIVCNAA